MSKYSHFTEHKIPADKLQEILSADQKVHSADKDRQLAQTLYDLAAAQREMLILNYFYETGLPKGTVIKLDGSVAIPEELLTQ